MRVGACVRRVAATTSLLLVLSPMSLPTSLSTFASLPTASASACPAGTVGYEVRAGDGWFAIAGRADVGLRSLLDANDASADDALHPGDRLCLPGGADLAAVCDATATVRAGDGWSSIADRAGVPLSALLTSNGAGRERTLHPGDTVCVPEGTGGTASSPTAGPGYTVAQGDSWYRIAERAGTTVSALLAVNGASAGEALHPGDEIRLPAGSSAPEPNDSRGVALAAAPVQGPCWYGDSWGDARSGGRAHVGVDVFTSPREYVYAVADGRLTLRRWAHPGSISGNAWKLSADDGTDYFYAHLFDFAPDLRVGSRVEAGQIIGWVGATGNTTVDHLHFEIRPGGGRPVDPAPILRAHGGGCNDGAPYRQPGGWIPD